MKNEGFMPATHVHGLSFGAAFPAEQRRYPIVCLDSSAKALGRRYVVYLGQFDGERRLDLREWYGDWDGRWRFLGVQEVSDT
jgi:hypothetical protein